MLRRPSRVMARVLAILPILPACALAQSTPARAPAPLPAYTAATPAAVATTPADTAVARGESLAAAGNCVSCHTRPGGTPFSGGVPFDTPYGTIYSTNITPDTGTGIGRWSAADLSKAMHDGLAPDGSRLFPAFPYTSFTKVTDADVGSIFAYLRTVPPARYTPPGNGFFLNIRWPLAAWDGAFFKAGRFSPDASQSAQWNRGAYLVEGLGHCSACHTPRNWAMAEVAARNYAGGALQDEVVHGRNRRWSAVNLTSAKSGLAAWSVNDLTKYLQTGFSLRAGTFGPMNEVIANSLRKLPVEDVRAMAVYLKSLPAQETTEAAVPAELVKAGESIYKERCEKCHGASGRGGVFSGPPLAGSAVAQAEDPASLINIILYGPKAPPGVSLGAWETMPAYDTVLDDAQIAAVSNYVRGSWGNRAGALHADDITHQR
jgi:alcohol dehydrogenase (quinone), cytochrome c subunit